MKAGPGSDPGGCALRPPRLQVVRVDPGGDRVVTVVIRGWRDLPTGRLLLLYRFQVERGSGAVRVALVNGCSVPPCMVPGLVLDLARTLALDSIGALASDWGRW